MWRGLSLASEIASENRTSMRRTGLLFQVPPFINSDLRFYSARSNFLKVVLGDVRRAIHSCDKKCYQAHWRSFYTLLLLSQRRVRHDSRRLPRLFYILALPDLVLRKSSGPVVHIRKFNVQSLGVNAILIVTNTALLLPFCALLSCCYIICFTCCLQKILLKWILYL